MHFETISFESHFSINVEFLVRCISLLQLPVVQTNEELKVKYLLLFIDGFSQSPHCKNPQVCFRNSWFDSLIR
jgi:hypothetical protein